MRQSKRDIAIILATANRNGDIRMKDHKSMRHHMIHRTEARIETASNGKKMIVARSPDGKHKIYRIKF